MRTSLHLIFLFISIQVFGQSLTPKTIGTSTPFGRQPVSKAAVDALKQRSGQRVPQGIILDYDGADETLSTGNGGFYERFIWDLNSNYPQWDTNRFALNWALVRFDTLYDANTGISYPRSSTPVTVDSIDIYITHENIVGTDTIVISVYPWTGAAGITVDAQNEINVTPIWDTMIIAPNSLTAAANQLGILTVYPRVSLTYPNNRYSVGVHFYGDTTFNFFSILAGYSDYCGGACFASPSEFDLNSLYKMIAWAGQTDLTGINNLVYNCNQNGTSGEEAECELFPIQNFVITSYVTINPALSATVTTPVTKCQGQSVQLNVVAAGGTPPYNYSWSPTTGLSNPFSATPSTVVNTNTVYTVTVGDNAGGSTTKTVSVTLSNITVNAGNDQQIGCGQTTTLTPTLGGITSGATYLWSNGRTTLNNTNVSPGTYIITVTNSAGCTASDAVTVSIPNVTQSLGFTTSLTNNTGCTGTSIQFTNTSTRQNGWNWVWDFDNGNISTAKDPTQTFSSSGTYTVILNADSAGCTVAIFSRTLTITNCSGPCVPSSPTGVPGLSPQWECLPCAIRNNAYSEVIQIENFSSVGGITILSVKLDSITNLPAGLGYTVNPTNGIIGTGGTGCIDISGTTNATVGTYQLGIYVTVNIQGLGLIDGELSQIVNDLIQIGVIDSSQAPDFSYYIRVIQQGGNCNIPPTCGSSCNLPVANYSYTVSGSNYTFLDFSTNSPTSWSWDFDDGGFSTQQFPTHTFSTGTYNVCLTAINNCGSNTTCQTVTVGGCAAPAAVYTYTASGTSVSFTDRSPNGPTSWSWAFGDGATSTQQSPSHTYANSGTYSVCLTAANVCGNNTTCQNITVTCAAPSAVFSHNAAGTSVSFTDNSTNGPSSWSWTFGDGSTSTQENPSHTYANSGSYSVCLTVTNSCGNNTTCQTISVTCAAPASAFSIDDTGTDVVFTDNSTNGATQWSWTFGDGSSSTQQNPTHSYSNAGTYTVCLTATNSCGNNTSCQSFTINCALAPLTAFGFNATGTTVVFADSSTNGPTSWAWTFGDGSSSSQQNPSHTFANPGTYTACLTAANACGSTSNCATITVFPVGIAGVQGLEPLKIYPNPFTETTTIEVPDAVKGAYDVKIYNLIGNEVRTMSNLSGNTLQLQRDNLANGVYFVEIRAEQRYFGKVVLK